MAANPTVDLIKLPEGRLWRMAVYLTYQRNFAAVFAPGVDEHADWLALKTRRALGRRLCVIDTYEGLLAGRVDGTREQEYSGAAGHPVYCQRIDDAQMRRIDEIYRMSDHIIAISPFLGRMASFRYGDKVSVLPLGVDTKLFGRSSFLPGDRPRVISAGRVASHKRPEIFLKLAETFPQADFAWYGEGDLRYGLIETAAARGLENLTFPGPLSPQELAGEYKKSDILVVPSLGEGVPKITQESAAAGLAQIIFGFYEAPTVSDGENGFVVWTDLELTERLGDLLASRELIEKMGRAGMRMAEAWSWEVVAPQWEKCISAVVSSYR